MVESKHQTYDSCSVAGSQWVCSYFCNEGYHNFGTKFGGHCTTCTGGEHMIESASGHCACEDGYYSNYRPDTLLQCANHNNEMCCLPCSRFPHRHEVGTAGSHRRCVCDDGFPHLTPAGCVSCSSIPHAVESRDGQSCKCEPGYFWTDVQQTKCALQATCSGQLQMEAACRLADGTGDTMI